MKATDDGGETRMTRPRAALLLASASGAVAALVVVGILALAGAFDAGPGGSGDSRASSAPAPAPLARGGDDDGGRIHDLYLKSSPGVAFIQARVVERQASPFGAPTRQQGLSTGSGFVLDNDGYILTNAHVVEGARDVVVRFKQDEAVRAQIIGSDLSNDLALLKVDPDKTKLTPLPLGDSSKVQVGEPVVAIGNPLGLAESITSGIVSAKQRFIQAPNGFTIENVIQTDATVNPGNSGGPLIDAAGRVIGINSQIATAPRGSSDGFIGIAFAIPIDTARDVVPDLKDDGKVEAAYLGVTTVTVSAQLAQQFGLGRDRGALVVAVSQGSPADDAGVKGGGGTGGALTGDGDVIVGVGDRDIAGSEDLANAIADLKPGQTVTLNYVRDGDPHSVRVKLANRPGSS